MTLHLLLARKVVLPVLFGGLVTMASACGGSSEASTNAVASLDDSAPSEAVEGDAATEDLADAALAYTQCMRDNSVEMGDPTFDADGNLEPGSLFGGPDSGFDPQSEDFQTAQIACGDLLDGIAFGGGPGGGGGFDASGIEEGLLTYTSCLRDEGLNVDDITFGAPGGGGPGGADGVPADGGPPTGGADGGFEGRPPGQGPGGGPGGEGFDPTAQLIEQLDLDDSDPEVAAALEVCAPVLDEAFSRLGPDGTDS